MIEVAEYVVVAAILLVVALTGPGALGPGLLLAGPFALLGGLLYAAL